jgi:hypothetical protein
MSHDGLYEKEHDRSAEMRQNFKPDPDKDGKIPCVCCNNGMRKNGITKERYVCNHCKGSQRRLAPPHYKPTSQILAEQEAERQRVRDNFMDEDAYDYPEAAIEYAVRHCHPLGIVGFLKAFQAGHYEEDFRVFVEEEYGE